MRSQHFRCPRFRMPWPVYQNEYRPDLLLANEALLIGSFQSLDMLEQPQAFATINALVFKRDFRIRIKMKKEVTCMVESSL